MTARAARKEIDLAAFEGMTPDSMLPLRDLGAGVVALSQRNAGGFSVRNCPEHLQLAAYLVHACNNFPTVLSELKSCREERDALAVSLRAMIACAQLMNDATDEENQTAQRIQEAIEAARAALQKAGIA